MVLEIATAAESERRARRPARVAAPVFLGVVAFVLVSYFTGMPRRDRSWLPQILDRPIPSLTITNVPLQVVVHDLLESIPAGPAVRVCRAVANQPVTVNMEYPEPLRVVLENLATQVGVHLVLASGQPSARTLPTMLCPNGVGGYLVIG